MLPARPLSLALMSAHRPPKRSPASRTQRAAHPDRATEQRPGRTPATAGSGRSRFRSRPGSRHASGPAEAGEARSCERVQRLIARAGRASRRAAEQLIVAGRVTINGRVARLGDRAEVGDDVRVDGKQLHVAEGNVTYALNKPPGYVTTAKDERGRATVFALLPPTPGLHAVGRLDRDSEGLLLLTTDGDLTLHLTHPRYELEKEYRVWTKQGRVDGTSLKRLVDGVELEDGRAAALSARPAPGGAAVVLAEGRKREVRRMFKALGYTVDRLVRVRVGGLKLGDLAVGAVRELSAKDLRALGYTREQRPG